MDVIRPATMNDQPIPPDQGGPPQSDQQSPAGSSWEGTGARATERIQLIIDAAEQAAAGIIEDAEAQARKYVEESRMRAERIAAQRATKMWALTDDLIARAEAVKRQSDELLHALDEAKRGVEEAVQTDYGLPYAPPEDGSPAPPDHLRSVSSPPDQPSASRQAPPPPLVEPSPSVEPQSAEPPPERPVAAEQAPLQDASPGASPWAPSEPPPPVEPSPPVEPPRPRYEMPAPPRRPFGSQPSEGARLLATQMAVAGSNREEIQSRLSHEFGIHDTGPMLDAILGLER